MISLGLSEISLEDISLGYDVNDVYFTNSILSHFYITIFTLNPKCFPGDQLSVVIN